VNGYEWTLVGVLAGIVVAFMAWLVWWFSVGVERLK
jgi:hypothetical protein